MVAPNVAPPQRHPIPGDRSSVGPAVVEKLLLGPAGARRHLWVSRVSSVSVAGGQLVRPGGKTAGGSQVLRGRWVGILADRVADVARIITVFWDAGCTTRKNRQLAGRESPQARMKCECCRMSTYLCIKMKRFFGPPNIPIRDKNIEKKRKSAVHFWG